MGWVGGNAAYHHGEGGADAHHEGGVIRRDGDEAGFDAWGGDVGSGEVDWNTGRGEG